MRSNTKRTTFEHSEVAASSRFSIKDSGKAFRALIDGLYSDKYKAVVQELAANAFDSHLKAKVSEAFYIHLPTELRPEFYVRDYGVGMDHEKIMGLYTTLFDSDKDGDNDNVGMFGLGSKTPFAYTDQFHITAYDGTTARFYAAGINQEGIPEIKLFQSIANAEKRGIRVGFAVDGKDFDAFKKATQTVVHGYETPFECNTHLESLGKPTLRGKDWTSYAQKSRNNFLVNPSQATSNKGFWVRQGCVLYPLSPTGGLNIPRASEIYILDCPIGTVEVAVSREQVAYTEDTVKYLSDRIEKLTAEVRDLVWKQVKDIEDVSEFFQKIESIRPSFLSARFTHPVTGLQTSAFQIDPPPNCTYDARLVFDNARWEFTVSSSMQAGHGAEERFLIEDFSAFLDEDRPSPTHGFTEREQRRIARHLRNWLDKKKIQNGKFLLGVKKSKEFWHAFQPNLKLTKITTKDILSAAPKRPLSSAPKIVRGVSVFSGGQQTSVTEIDTTIPCWVPADVYRTHSAAVESITKLCGIKKYYVVASLARQKIIDSGIPSIANLLEEVTPKKLGFPVGMLLSISNYSERQYLNTGFLHFVLKLKDKSPKVYDRLLRTKSVASEFLKKAKPLIDSRVIEPESGINSLLSHILTQEQRKEGVKQFAELRAIGTPLYRGKHPGIALIESARSASSKEELEAVAEAIMIVFKTIPITLKFEAR